MQYNKKRLIYTNITYGEASIRLHDSVDDAVLAFWVDYFTYFFADSRSTMGTGADVNSASNAAGVQQAPGRIARAHEGIRALPALP